MNEIKTAISKLIYLRHDENTRDHELLTAIDELETALTASADSVQERERLEEALSGVLERHTQLSTDALDEVVPKLADVALAADANLRLTKGEQEPVARVNHAFDRGVDWITDYTRIQEGTRLYTAPQAQQTLVCDKQESGKDAQDAARLDWLQQHDGHFYNIDRIAAIVGVGFNRMSSLREAIDKAMQASPQAEAQYAHKPECDLLKPATLNGYAVVRNCDCGYLEQAEAQHSKGARE